MSLFRTQNLNLKTSLLSLAVLVTLSSCGKSKELKTEGPAEQPAVAQPATQTPPVVKDPNNLNSEAPASGPSNQLTPDEPNAPGTNPTTPPVAPTTNPGTAPLPPAPSTQTPGGQAQLPVPPVMVEVPSLLDIDFAHQVVEKTGGQKQDLFYTGAGQDGLMNEFKAYAGKVSPDQQVMNKNLAKAITVAKLSSSSSDLTIDLAIDESINGVGSVKNYHLKAIADGNMMKLMNVTQASNGSLAFQGGFLKCLDLDGSCHNAYAKIKMSGAYTRVIFRKSYADTHFIIQDKQVNNSKFEMMKSYINNRADDSTSNQQINGVQVSSFEVVNGGAGLGAMIATADSQMIGLSIPLVVSGTNSEVNAQVSKTSDVSKNYDLAFSAGSYGQLLSQQVDDVKLIKNNGRGQIKLKMSFGQGADQASIWVVIAKVLKPQMTLEQVRAFEATLKNF
ncbi:MAG: hypothetical protein WA160_06740 [Pseudobdellovibrio sp.]